MPQITAAAVKALRDRTGLPMMECKTALSESGGDEDAAITWLRERGAKTMEKRSERETSFGRMGIYLGLEPEVGAMVEHTKISSWVLIFCSCKPMCQVVNL